MTEHVQLEYLGASAIITINHPPANLLTLEALQELGELLRSAPVGQARALLLTGEGDTFFSAGLALNQLSGGALLDAEQMLDALIEVCQLLRAQPGVTVAAVNGYALGAGLECALACDYLVAERGALLGMTQARVGLIPGAGGIKSLSDKIGSSWCKRMVLGGEVLDAERACAIGLVEEVVEPGLAKIVGLSLGDKVARQGPHAVQVAKALMRDCAGQALSEHITAARQGYLQLIGTEEQRAGVAAFLEKRSPPWCEDDDD